MHLGAMMRLVIEEMGEDPGETRLLGLAARRMISEQPVERRIVVAVDNGDESGVLGFPRLPQADEVVIENLVERLEAGILAGDPTQPDAIAHDQVIERAVDRAEEGEARLMVLDIRKLRASRVEASVGPGVVAGEVVEIGGLHDDGSPPGVSPALQLGVRGTWPGCARTRASQASIAG